MSLPLREDRRLGLFYSSPKTKNLENLGMDKMRMLERDIGTKTTRSPQHRVLKSQC